MNSPNMVKAKLLNPDNPGLNPRTSPTADAAARLSKEDWLRLAIQTLIQDGIDNVKIQSMARDLNVARSSFYWFFKNIDDLHRELLEHWLTKNTEPIIERAKRPAPTIHRAILNVFECWVEHDLFDPQLDIAVRLWARRSDVVRRVVEQADKQRIEALTLMFRRYDFEAHEAVIRARTIYMTQIGQYTLDFDEPQSERHSYLPFWLKVFTGLEAESSDVEYFFDYLRQKKIEF